MADRVVVYLNSAGSRQGVAPSESILVGGIIRGSGSFTINGSGAVDVTGVKATINGTGPLGVIINGTVVDINATNDIFLNAGTAITASNKLITTSSATLAALEIGSFAGDPSTLVDGDLWYNSTLAKFRKYENGAISNLNSSEAATFVVHPTAGAGDFTTIQAALNALPAEGGMILVREGAYSLSATLTLPNKPVAIIGCGDATVLDLGTNAIPAFTAGFAKKYTISDLNVTGSTDVNRRVVTVSANATFQMNRVVAIAMRQIAEVTGGASAQLDFNFCKFQSLLNNVASWFVNAGPNTFVRATSTSVEGTFNAGGINGGPPVDLIDCTISAANGVDVGEDSTMTGVAFNGNAGETITLGDRTKVSNCYFFQVMVDAAGSEIKVDSSEFEGTLAQNRLLDITGSTGPTVVGCSFKGGDTDHIGVNFAVDTVIKGCLFFDNGSLVRAIDINLASRAIIVGNNFQFMTEAIRTSGNAAIVADNVGCIVLETGGATDNRYSNNSGFTGSTIIGAGSMVEGVRRFDSVGATTSGSFTTLFTHTNPKGVVGVGTIKNTGGVNSLEIKETVIDAFGITDSVTTTVLFGDSYLLDPLTNFATARPPHVSYKVEVRHPTAATTYTIHHATEGAL